MARNADKDLTDLPPLVTHSTTSVIGGATQENEERCSPGTSSWHSNGPSYDPDRTPGRPISEIL